MFPSDYIKGIAYAIITGLLFGLEYLIIAWTFHNKVSDFSVLSMTAINFFGSFLLALLFLRWKKKFWKRVFETFQKNTIVVISTWIIIAIGIFSLFFAVTQSSAGSTSLLERTQLLFILFFGTVFLKEKLSGIEIIGISISILGFIGISSFPTDLNIFSSLAILTGAFLYALQSFLVKKYIPNVDGLAFAFLRVGGAGALLVLLLISIEGFSSTLPNISESFILALAGFFGAFVSRYFYFEAHNLHPISFLNVFILLEAVVVVLGEMIFFDFVPFSWTKIIAGSIILLGLIILSFSKEKS